MPQVGDNGKVKLLKASAGAGKTHFLTQEYIRMILEGTPDSYRHILAVTFTNKATEEMKTRVIQELHKIASDSNNPDSDKARDRLVRILHDYSHFSISTIDRFFQTVIRSFAREIGQYASYRVELDTSSVIDSTVDLLLDSLDRDEHSDLFHWLDEYSARRVEKGESWDFVKSLKGMAREFFTENFKVKLRQYGNAIGDRDDMRQVAEVLDTVISSFETEVRSIGERALEVMGAASLSEQDFKGKSTGPFTVFRKWARGDYEAVPKEKLRTSYNNHELPELVELVERGLALFDDVDGEFKKYRTAKLIRSTYHLMGVYSDIYDTLQQYLKENNLILLGESNDLLSRIIDGNDTPFVYEKTGTRYDHIMLDEAQDTSVLQWQNFKPLFQETLSNGNGNLVVGDIKQSIYRWRGSDWRLMSDYIYADLGRDRIFDDDPMNENWRSLRTIMDFNNMIYGSIGNAIKIFDCQIGEQVASIYDNSNQTIPDKRECIEEPGYVGVSFIDECDTMDCILEEIGTLLDSGYKYSDIAILTRTNSQGSAIADFLVRNHIGVITDESLLLGGSPCICHLMDVLQYVIDPDDKVNRMMVSGLEGVAENGLDGSLFSICETLLSSGLFAVGPGDVPFVHSFLDSVLEYQDKFGSSLRGLLKWWDESGRKKSINVPEGQDAVRIMTIHKAKGLSLEAVIIPYFKYAFVSKGYQRSTLWCKADEPFGGLGLVPVPATGSDTVNTYFEDDFRMERMYKYIDEVNLAYVATTRARSSMKILAPLQNNPEKPSADIGGAFYSILKEKLNESGNYEDGVRGPHRSDAGDESAKPLLQLRYDIEPAGSRLRIKREAEDYFSPIETPRMHGIELHKVLEMCDFQDDLEGALEQAVSDGTLRQDKLDETSIILRRAFDKVCGRHWFDGTYRSLNEISIIDSSGRVHRPDRVLVDDECKKAIVIDYKFGSDRDSYSDQVRLYGDLLREIGYSDISGFLWFPESGTVKEVC